EARRSKLAVESGRLCSLLRSPEGSTSFITENMVLNRQSEVAISLPGVRRFVRRLRGTLELDGRDFNVCFVSDREIERLNATYRGKPRATDEIGRASCRERV